MSKRAVRAAAMRRLVARWRQSGLSLKRFADQHGVPSYTLYYWRQREGRRRAGEARLVPVKVLPAIPPAPQRRYGLVLRNGVEVRVPAGFVPEELARLLAVAAAC